MRRRTDMSRYSVTVMLQFPAMHYAYRVEVSLRQLLFLDRTADRSFAPDGTVLYQLSKRGSPEAHIIGSDRSDLSDRSHGAFESDAIGRTERHELLGPPSGLARLRNWPTCPRGTLA